ncbi:hypothetical protein HMPREF1487_09410 [Pseudomonas sp. HPB0071]|uniref:Uncharacterized protein n=1 Tax=Pseudomonas luteola TaxID=47886 RepID=A0A2X2BY68_PSELU|nr:MULTISPECIES: hypothetical protein [Pseudomonas]ENA26931.1 hypothetical protein HMPREF1487_09410 [Pseudomonas sp. HPB0071]MBA1250211.1 hypothetical protein [Pseudomonas zeshuii]MBH3441734.1 hypothetical protein [Pseudomonas luteola]SPY99933.1 Uncharacterised protein [Pseudomonas luteola]
MKNAVLINAKFETGAPVLSNGVIKLFGSKESAFELLVTLRERHESGDWGNVSDEIKLGNDEALLHMGEVVSVFAVDLPDGRSATVCMTTGARHDTTRLHLPGE